MNEILDHAAVGRREERHCDVVVVGTGPGGAAAARALSQRGAKVTLLEEGPAKTNFRPNQAHAMRWHFQEGGGMLAQGSAYFPVMAGRGVGGGSLVNSAIALRTPDAVLRSWVARLGGDDRYDPAHMAVFYDEVERAAEVGPTSDAVAGENNRIIVRGARALGLEAGLLPRNAPRCLGCGLCNYGCPVGGKASVDRNLIVEARQRGAEVQAEVKVDRILVEDGRAVGVSGVAIDPETRQRGGHLTVRAGVVVIAAGGIGTPRLLHHAGLAPILGPAVGRGLHVHPGSGVLALCDYEVHLWDGASQAAYYLDPEMPGVLPHTFNAPPGIALLALGEVGHDNKTAQRLLNHVCGCLALISDRGEGTVGAHPDGRADIRYHFARADLGVIQRSLVRSAEVLMAGGAVEVFAPIHGVGRHRRLDTFAQAVGRTRFSDYQFYSSHPMASCRMGADAETSVIGPSGEAHRLPGLFLADSSIFPTSLGVNPQLTTMAMGTAIGRALPLA